MTNVVSFGFLGTGPTNVAAFGFLGANIPPPATVTVVGGGGDKAKRDREAYYLKRRLKMKKSREFAREPQLRMEPVKAPVIEPKIIDFRPQGQMFRQLAGPQPLQAPKAEPLEPLPTVPEHHDDEDFYLVTE